MCKWPEQEQVATTAGANIKWLCVCYRHKRRQKKRRVMSKYCRRQIDSELDTEREREIKTFYPMENHGRNRMNPLHSNFSLFISLSLLLAPSSPASTSFFSMEEQQKTIEIVSHIVGRQLPTINLFLRRLPLLLLPSLYTSQFHHSYQWDLIHSFRFCRRRRFVYYFLLQLFHLSAAIHSMWLYACHCHDPSLSARVIGLFVQWKKDRRRR